MGLGFRVYLVSVERKVLVLILHAPRRRDVQVHLIDGLRFGVVGLGVRVSCFRFQVWGFGVWGLGFGF